MKMSDLTWKDRMDPYGPKMMQYVVEQNKIYEGLIWSQPCGYVIGKLKEHYKNIRCSYDAKLGNKFILIFNTVNMTIQQLNDIFKLTNNYGWFSSQAYFNQIEQKWTPEIMRDILNMISNNQSNIIELQFESKYDIELESKIIPSILFHATPTKFVNKILKQGLVPTSKNPLFMFPDRIYLSFNYTDLTQVLLPDMAKKSKIPDWTIFEVKADSLKNQNVPLTKWFKDPNYNGGIYVLKNISPSMITIKHQLTFNIT